MLTIPAGINSKLPSRLAAVKPATIALLLFFRWLIISSNVRLLFSLVLEKSLGESARYNIFL